jgi:acyl carrier protein
MSVSNENGGWSFAECLEIVRDLWASSLPGALRLSSESDFFTLGGDSLGLLEIIGALSDKFDTVIDPMSLLSDMTVSGFANAIFRTQQQAGAPLAEQDEGR